MTVNEHDFDTVDEFFFFFRAPSAFIDQGRQASVSLFARRLHEYRQLTARIFKRFFHQGSLLLIVRRVVPQSGIAVESNFTPANIMSALIILEKAMAPKQLNGTLRVPGDKSITHRGLIFSTLASGTCRVSGMSPAQDCASSAACLAQLGLQIERTGADEMTIHTDGLRALRAPETILNAGNSGTTMRLLAGVLSGRAFRSVLDGDDSLRSRPMSRVLDPLGTMGVEVQYLGQDNCAPFAIEGTERLRSAHFELKVASAQVQTALLLAGLQTEGETTVRLPAAVRDHTTRMFKMMGVPFKTERDNELSITVTKLEKPVPAYSIVVPADISSAAFFMVAAACLPGSDVTLTDVVLNPGRDLIVEVLQEMGADLTVTPAGEACGEPIGVVRIRGAELRGTTLGADRLARGIDEVPVLALAGAICSGEFRLEGGAELRVKESDRIAAIVLDLALAGADIEETGDGFVIKGKPRLAGGSKWRTFDDHRMAMAGMIASVIATEPVEVDNSDCVAVSYPNFAFDLKRLTESA